MNELVIIWDDEDDRNGNYWHICVEGHGLPSADVEEVLRNDDTDIEVSRSTGRTMAFGWTSSGDRIAVVFEQMSDDPKIVYPVSAYPVRPKRAKRGRKR